MHSIRFPYETSRAFPAGYGRQRASRNSAAKAAHDRPLPPPRPRHPPRLLAGLPIAEERYDVPDTPMPGDMDPPSSSPRTRTSSRTNTPAAPSSPPPTAAVAPRSAARPPSPATGCPSASPRLDLSGFWFRPTRLAAWARDRASWPRPPAPPASASPPAAAPSSSPTAPRPAGPRPLHPQQGSRRRDRRSPGRRRDRLARLLRRPRRARHPLRLPARLARRPPARAALPFDADARRSSPRSKPPRRPCTSTARPTAAARSRSPCRAAARAAHATIAIEGEASTARQRSPYPRAPAGATRLALGPAADLPADFRHYTVTLDAGGFAASRTLGVEIARDRGLAARRRPRRRGARAVAARGEPDACPPSPASPPAGPAPRPRR